MLANLALRTQLILLTLIFITITLILGLKSIYDEKTSLQSTEQIYMAVTLPLAEIGRSLDALHRIRTVTNNLVMLSPQIRANEVKQLNELQEAAANAWRNYYASLDILVSPEEKHVADQIQAIVPNYRKSLAAILATTAHTSDEEFDRLASDIVNDINRITPLLRELTLKVTELAEHHNAAQKEHSKTVIFINTILLGIALTIGPLMAFILISLIKRGMNEAVYSAQAISEKRLNRAIPQGSKGNEIGKLFLAFEKMQDELKHVIGNINQGSQQLAQTSMQLNQSTDHILRSSNEQTQAAETAAQAVEKLTHSIEQVNDRAKSTKEAAELARIESQSSSAVIRKTSDQVQSISETMQSSVQLAEELGERSQQIGIIVNTIRDIADQTNLLALNAAIEAARAGETGRGFAVVADEVRKLAERTTSSTEEIGRVINDIRQSIDTMVNTMKNSESQVNEGISMANNARHAIDNITKSSQHVLELIAGISQALEEQSSASQLVAKNVEHITDMATQNNHAVQKVSESSVALDQLAKRLHKDVSEFQF